MMMREFQDGTHSCGGTIYFGTKVETPGKGKVFAECEDCGHEAMLGWIEIEGEGPSAKDLVEMNYS